MNDRRSGSSLGRLFDLYFMFGGGCWPLVFLGCFYLAFIYLLTTVVAPLLAVGLTLVLSATVSWLCAKIFWQTYAPQSSSPAGLVVITGILLMLYSDFLLLLNAALGPAVGSFPLFSGVVSILPSAWLVGYLGTWFGLEPSGVFAVLLAIFLKGLMLPAILLSFRGLACTDPHPAEPAFLSYFQKAAFRDLHTALRGCLQGIPQHLRPIANWITKNSLGGKAAKFVWPLGIAALLALIPPILFATVFLGSIVLIYVGGLLLLQAFNFFLAYLLFVAELLVMKIRAGYAKCPHSGCYEPLPLPIILCPGCGAEHHKLLPGRTGIFYCRCRCGQKLPTPGICWAKGTCRPAVPNAKASFPTRFAERTFTCRSTEGRRLENHLHGGRRRPSGPWRHRGSQNGLAAGSGPHRFRARWQRILAGGAGPNKTVDLLPNAYLISLRGRPAWRPVLPSMTLREKPSAPATGWQVTAHGVLQRRILVVDPTILRRGRAGPADYPEAISSRPPPRSKRERYSIGQCSWKGSSGCSGRRPWTSRWPWWSPNRISSRCAAR